MNALVSFIIVNYNTKDLIRDCIQSIYKQNFNSKYEIIVVDNNSNDGSCDVILKEFPNVILIKSPENLGFGRANNLGISYAKGDYYFFLNSDTILLNNAIDYFVDYCIKNTEKKIGALGCILLDKSLNNIHSYGEFITIKSLLLDIIYKYKRLFKKGQSAYQEYLYPSNVHTSLNVEYITGADLFVPAKVVDTIGAFDPLFFMYCEEVDWQIRMHNEGYMRLIIPGPKIIHLEGASDPSLSRHRSIGRICNIFTSQIQYIRKHNSRFNYYVFRILFAILWFLPIIIRSESIYEKSRVIRILFSPSKKNRNKL